MSCWELGRINEAGRHQARLVFGLGHTTTVIVAERGGVQYGEPRFGRTKRAEGLKAAVGREMDRDVRVLR